MSENHTDAQQRQYKVVLLGDGAVGKTSIAARFANDTFTQKYKQTIGLDFFVKHLILPGDTQVAMQLWDIGGQSIGSKMLQNYICGAKAILLCYDITNHDSFANLGDWYKLVRHAFRDVSMPFVGLVANKCNLAGCEIRSVLLPAGDLSHLRAVKSDLHNRFADENVLYSFMMSAKSGDQVTSCFVRVAMVLANTSFSKRELDAAAHTVVKATIIEHAQHDPGLSKGAMHGVHNKCCSMSSHNKSCGIC